MNNFTVAKQLVQTTALSCIAAVLALSVLANVGHAAILASDGFNYAAGALSGKGGSGDTGWNGGWVATAGVTVVTDLTPPLTTNPAVQLTQPNNDNAAYRTLSSVVNASKVFVSFTFRFGAGTITNNDFMGLWFDNNVNSGNSHTAVPNIGLKAEVGPGGSDYFVRVTGTDGKWSTAVQAKVESTIQIVGELSKTGTSTTFNSYQLWVNPDLSDLGTPDITDTATGGLTSFDMVGFRTANLATGDLLYVDDLRIATSWTDVVVPEPATIIIWSLLGGFGIVVGCRRKRAA